VAGGTKYWYGKQVEAVILYMGDELYTDACVKTIHCL
jgi:hypothetical protein